jgi:hypothetical protein
MNLCLLRDDQLSKGVRAVGDFRFPVEPGHVLLFARAVGEPDSGAETLPVPPTFVQCASQFDPDWVFRPRAGKPWLGSGREPSGDPGAGDGSLLHAEQHFEYHRPLRAGAVLTVSTTPGKTWMKASRSGGELHFAEIVTEYRDETGALVVTSRAVSVRPTPPPPERTDDAAG